MKTQKGTELPLLDLRGKKYLQVAHRLVWFREEKPDWSIETEVKRDKDESIAKAIIRDPGGRIIATAHKHENAKGFADHTEKSETGAIGRALALCGYGTQFAPELDEADRLADAPIDDTRNRSHNDRPLQPNGGNYEYRIPFGKYKGLTLQEVGIDDLRSYVEWMDKQPDPERLEAKKTKDEFISKAERYIGIAENFNASDYETNQQEDIPF